MYISLLNRLMFETLSGWIQRLWKYEWMKAWTGKYIRPEWVNAWNPEHMNINALNGIITKTLSRWLKQSINRILTNIIHEKTSWMGKFEKVMIETSTLNEWIKMFRVDEFLKSWTCEYKHSEQVNVLNPVWVNTNILGRWMFETLCGWIHTNTLSGWMLETLNRWIQTPWVGKVCTPELVNKSTQSGWIQMIWAVNVWNFWNYVWLNPWTGEWMNPWMGK